MANPSALGGTLRSWLERAVALMPGTRSPWRDREYAALIDAVVELSVEGDMHARLPEVIHGVLEPRGYAWNGIYALADANTLSLVAAHGPPVCTQLERRGGLGMSGMCWDAVILGRTLVANRVAAWPGYVSCDTESGLRTLSGLVCPLRDLEGRIVAVWDLDCTAELPLEDVVFFDALWGTLGALIPSRFLAADEDSR